MGNDERTKLSWREIDKARDGSGRPNRPAASSAAGSGRPAGRSEEDQRQKQYRAALEAAFEKGELGKLAEKLNVVRGVSEEPARPAPVVATAAPSPSPGPESAEGAATAAPGSDEAAGRGGKKKPGEDKATLLRKFLEASSQKDISRNAERYLSRFPLPDDHEFLEQLLEHEKEARVREALVRISELLDRRHMPKRTRALIGKLRYLTETSSSDELRERASSLLQRIK